MRPAAAVVALVLLAGCGSSNSAVERDLRRGMAQIRTTHDAKTLRAELRGTLASLRRDSASTAGESGNIEAATRDALRANRFRARGARLLTAARRVLANR